MGVVLVSPQSSPQATQPNVLTTANRPIITFVVILLLPSILTFITLLIHRVRAARAAQRDRAPEDFVHRLPWRIWTGSGWEKHAAGLSVPEDPTEDQSSAPDRDLERGDVAPSASDADEPAWVDQQMECAICLEMFVKGDRVRVLPCNHLFHLVEVDEWLIQKKKVVSLWLHLRVALSGSCADVSILIHQCPICKADITQPRPHPSNSRSSSHESDISRAAAPSALPSAPEPTERSPLLPNSSS